MIPVGSTASSCGEEFSVANFTGPDGIATGVPVTFTDMSIGDPVRWTWTIENKTYHTQNATHTFITPGRFTVTLKIENEEGGVGSIQKAIGVVSPPLTVQTLLTPSPSRTVGLNATGDRRINVNPLSSPHS